jgi:hypothetical protein
LEAIFSSVLLAGPIVVQSPEHPEVVVNIDTDGLCVWAPETARDCPPDLLQRFAPLASEVEANTLGAPLFVAFVREPGEDRELALIASTRPPEPHIEGDERRFGPAQVDLLCDSPTRCDYTTEEIDGVATVTVMESLPNRAYAVHTIFRGEQATVYAMLHAWQSDDSKHRYTDESQRWSAKLNAAISVKPAPLQADPQSTREPWLPVILEVLVSLAAAGIGIALLIARLRAGRA